MVGDFNGNRSLDASDIDLISAEILFGVGHQRFDLNEDSNINEEDIQVWVEDIKQTWFGDANLDGEFNSRDLVEVFTEGEFEDRVELNSTWKTGELER